MKVEKKVLHNDTTTYVVVYKSGPFESYIDANLRGRPGCEGWHIELGLESALFELDEDHPYDIVSSQLAHLFATTYKAAADLREELDGMEER